jgi:hypothetical protein
VLVQGLSSRISTVLLSRPLYALLHESPSLSILFVEENSDIGMEGWAAVGRALSSKRNFKNLNLCEERGNASSSDPDYPGTDWVDYADLTRSSLRLPTHFLGFSRTALF